MSETFRVVEGWEQLPEGMTHMDVADVGVDSEDNVYLITRREPRVIVYDCRGNFQRSWGEDIFSEKPHSLTVGPDDTLYITDELRNSVEAYSRDGRLLFPIGPSGATPSDTGADPEIPNIYDRIASIERSADPFNRPTKVAVAPSGDLYVTDGYANARVHRFDSTGELLGSWGEPGSEPGEFHLPHGLVVLPDGRVVVCDRENDRLQVFTPEGELLEIWTGFHRPGSILHHDGAMYLGELGWKAGHRTWMHGVSEERVLSCITVLDLDGSVIGRWGGAEPCTPDGMTSPHGIAVDSTGDLYVAETTWTAGGRTGVYGPDCHTFLKLTPHA